MKKLKKERDMLADALRDLDRELRDLRSTKKELSQKFSETTTQLDRTQDRKVKLQTQIALAMSKETNLLKKKSQVKDKMSSLDTRIQKVKAIERELKEVDG